MYLSYSRMPGYELPEINNPGKGSPEVRDKRFSDVKVGTYLPSFNLREENLNLHRTLKDDLRGKGDLIKRLSGKPLVIGFYVSGWGSYGLTYLKELDTIQSEINSLGANLVIVTQDATGADLEEITWINKLSLNFYFDPFHEVTSLFFDLKTYPPSWLQTGGLLQRILSPAVYVLDPVKHISYAVANQHLAGEIAPSSFFEALRRRYFTPTL